MRLLCVMLALFLIGCGPAADSQLQRIRQQGVLNVVTRNSATTYYHGPFGPTGLEFDLAAGFARHLGVRLKIHTADTVAGILHAIESGDADLAAAGLTVTQQRKAQVSFGPRYQYITAQLVYRTGTPLPDGLAQLRGNLEVVADSSHAEILRSLRDEYSNLSFEENESLESEQLLQLVWEQVIDYTVADSNEVAYTRRFYPELRVAFDLSPASPLAWAFPRGEDRSLISEAETYFGELRASGDLDQLLEHYYGYVSDFDYVGTRRYMRHIEQRLPRYERWFKQAGKHVGEDWRLLAAMGYQESHWDPDAVSPTGVRGIMMLTRRTMEHIGMDADRSDARSSIEGGARYLATVKERVPATITEPDRTWMSLAAYNVGFGHLQDARELAREAGANPDRWVDVKKFLPLLSRKKYHRNTRYGYARGIEPVRYVENVRTYYDILVWTTERDVAPVPVSPGLSVDSPVL